MTAGETYVISGVDPYVRVFVAPHTSEDSPMISAGQANYQGIVTFTVTAPNIYLWVNMSYGDDRSSTIQIEVGSTPTSYEPFY